MDPGLDASLAYAFAMRCEQVRAELRSKMRARGLREEDGWSIHESTRHDRGTMLVMRPIHMRLPAPPDLECTCEIDEPGHEISGGCRS
jgi:hypothetical protein